MLQWADNFSFYGSGAAGAENMMDGLPYSFIANGTGTQLPTDPDGVSSGRVLSITATNNNSNLLDTRMSVPTPVKALGVGARFYRTSLPGTNGLRPTIIGYRSAANARMYDLVVEPNGALSVYDSVSVLIATTTIPIFTTNTWQHIEFFVDSATGEIEVRREGVPVLTATEAVPQNANIGIISWTNRQNNTSNTSLGLYMKGLVVWDTTGTYNNDFMGTVNVVGCPVESDESNTGWTPSTGTDIYALLDESTPNDADYASAAAAAASVEMSLGDVPADSTSVRGVITVVRAMKTDGGDANLQVSLKSVAAYDAGVDHAITPTATYWWDVSEEDPNTTSPWTPGTFNDASIRINRTL
jgi:hypothetical protein